MFIDKRRLSQTQIAFLAQNIFQLLPKHQRIQVRHRKLLGNLHLIFELAFYGDLDVETRHRRLFTCVAIRVEVAVLSGPSGHDFFIVDQHRAIVALTTRCDLYFDVEITVCWVLAAVIWVKIFWQCRWIRVEAVGRNRFAKSRQIVVARLSRFAESTPQILIARDTPPSRNFVLVQQIIVWRVEIFLPLKCWTIRSTSSLHWRVVVWNWVLDLIELFSYWSCCAANAADAALNDFVGLFTGERWAGGRIRNILKVEKIQGVD